MVVWALCLPVVRLPSTRPSRLSIASFESKLLLVLQLALVLVLAALVLALVLAAASRAAWALSATPRRRRTWERWPAGRPAPLAVAQAACRRR